MTRCQRKASASGAGGGQVLSVTGPEHRWFTCKGSCMAVDLGSHLFLWFDFGRKVGEPYPVTCHEISVLLTLGSLRELRVGDSCA